MPHPAILTVTLNTAIDRVLEVEHFAIGGHLPAREVSRFPAGKGINLARALACIGRDAIATGFVGQDEADLFELTLKTHATDTPGRSIDQLLTAHGPTRENITILDPINHTDTHIRTAGYQLTRQDVQRIISKLGLLAREGTIVVFSGSLPPGMTVADLDTLIYMTIGGGARVVLDLSGKLLAECSSVDLSVVGETKPLPRPDAAAAAGDEAPKKMIWMVKPNRQELAEALGIEQLEGERALIDAGRRLTTRVTWVVLTLGAKGAILFGQEGVWRGWCDVKPDEIASTVGCGDCLLAGVLDAQARDEPPEEVLRHGIATATANALRSGVAEFNAELVHRLTARTHIEPVTLD